MSSLPFSLVPLLCALTVMPLSIRGEDASPLKTEYYESAVNSATAINYKRWDTFRNGKLIVKREERDLLHTGKFVQIDEIVFHDGQKILHFSTIDGKRSCFFHPQGGFTVLQSDSDGDGRYDRILVSDAKEQMVDSFSIGPDGHIVPTPDAELKKLQDILKQSAEAMKNFDKK
jgi:hypothetical protein